MGLIWLVLAAIAVWALVRLGRTVPTNVCPAATGRSTTVATATGDGGSSGDLAEGG